MPPMSYECIRADHHPGLNWHKIGALVFNFGVWIAIALAWWLL